MQAAKNFFHGMQSIIAICKKYFCNSLKNIFYICCRIFYLLASKNCLRGPAYFYLCCEIFFPCTEKFFVHRLRFIFIFFSEYFFVQIVKYFLYVMQNVFMYFLITLNSRPSADNRRSSLSGISYFVHLAPIESRIVRV